MIWAQNLLIISFPLQLNSWQEDLTPQCSEILGRQMIEAATGDEGRDTTPRQRLAGIEYDAETEVPCCLTSGNLDPLFNDVIFQSQTSPDCVLLPCYFMSVLHIYCCAFLFTS